MGFRFGGGRREAGPETREVISRVVAEPRWSVVHLALAMALAALLAIAGLTLFQHREALRQQEAAARNQATLAATLVAKHAAAAIQAQARRLEQLARDPRRIAVLMAQDPEAITREEAELRRLFPEALAVRLLPAGLREVRPQASPPISYATLDLLRQAESRRRAPPAEVHLVGQPQQHLNLDQPILDREGTRVLGHLLLSLPSRQLQTLLAGLESFDGRVQLLQRAGTKPVVLATAGTGKAAPAPAAVRRPVPGTRWEVAVWPRPVPAGLLPAAPGLVAPGVATLAFLLLLALATHLYRRRLLEDQHLLLGALRDARHTGLKTEYPIRLLDCMPMLKGIVRLFAEMPVPAAGEPRPSAPVPPEPPPPETGVAPPAPEAFEVLDESVLEDSDAAPAVNPAQAAPAPVPEASDAPASVDPAIFRAYDIRGIHGENLTPAVAEQIGRAVGSDALARGETAIFVGRDGRLSSPELAEALIRGLCATGIDVKDLGEVPTPVLYFATHQREESRSGVMVTGSHNPPRYNGMKIVLAGETLHGSGIQALRHLIEHQTFMQGQGSVERIEVTDDYVRAIAADIRIPRPLRIVADCGHGVAAHVLPALMSALECELIPLHCEVDGHFPAHHPDPGNPENLTGLIQAVREHQADLGLAFDGDGDRLGVVDSEGNIIWPDRLLMLLAMDLLSRNPGADVLFDVKCSRHLARIVRDFGGNPEMWKTGHSLLKARMKETGALLAGEMSGHIFYADRWYGFDDAFYAAARLIEIVANDHRPSARIFAVLPESVATPMIELPLPEGEEKAIMQRVTELAEFPDAEISTIDGLRVEFPDGWGLVRASHTTPSLTLRFEADDEAALERIRERFRALLAQAAPERTLPF